jgi:hypothetical protein
MDASRILVGLFYQMVEIFGQKKNPLFSAHIYAEINVVIIC